MFLKVKGPKNSRRRFRGDGGRLQAFAIKPGGSALLRASPPASAPHHTPAPDVCGCMECVHVHVEPDARCSIIVQFPRNISFRTKYNIEWDRDVSHGLVVGDTATVTLKGPGANDADVVLYGKALALTDVPCLIGAPGGSAYHPGGTPAFLLVTREAVADVPCISVADVPLILQAGKEPDTKSGASRLRLRPFDDPTLRPFDAAVPCFKQTGSREVTDKAATRLMAAEKAKQKQKQAAAAVLAAAAARRAPAPPPPP